MGEQCISAHSLDLPAAKPTVPRSFIQYHQCSGDSFDERRESQHPTFIFFYAPFHPRGWWEMPRGALPPFQASIGAPFETAYKQTMF